MKYFKLAILATVLLATFQAQASIEQVPGVISAPVVLYDDGSNTLADGQYSVIVAFKDSLSSVLFTEEHLVDVRNGVALISLGNGYVVGSGQSTSSGGLDVSVFDVATDISVEILVEGQSNPQELTILGSQPYAFISQKAITVVDDAITSSQIRNGSIKEEDLDESLVQALQGNSAVLVSDGEGGYTAVDVSASQVAVSSDIGLNNASGTTLDVVLQDLDNAIDTLRGTDLDQSMDSVNSSLSSHSSAASGVHGVTGNVVGTSDTQTLTNKTIDSTNSISGDAVKSGSITDARVPGIATHAGTTSGTHGVTGSIVGTTDTQTLQHKTLDSTNSVSADAVNSGTLSDSRIPSTITRDSELTFSNLSGSLLSSQLPSTVGQDITFDDASCEGGACTVDGVDISVLQDEVTTLSDESDDAVDDSRISAYLKPFAFGAFEGEGGCSSMELVSGYNVDHGTTGTSTTSIFFDNPVEQDSDLIIIVNEYSDPTSQDELDHECIRSRGYQRVEEGNTWMYIANCSQSADCNNIDNKKFSFVIFQIPR